MKRIFLAKEYRMRIAMIAAPIERVPPRKYGGTERVVSTLTEELVQMGHDVTLFASADSQTSAKLISFFPKPLREAYPSANEILERVQMTLLHLGKAYAMQDKFDIIHDHTSYFGLSYAQGSRTPVVSTIHGALTPKCVELYAKFNKPYLVSISQSQTKPAPQLNYIATVYNGLKMEKYPFSLQHKGYLLAVGRFSPEKGMHNAIAVARCLKMPLIIAAKLEDQHKEYFAQKIQPYLNQDIRWIGEVDERQRNKLMSHAYCFLHPLEWEEPFGLTIIESMACGTPVVAFNRGSMPEIIEDKKTGFIAKDMDEMCQLIPQVDHIDRKYCRSYSVEKFNSKKMAQEYEAVYEAILAVRQHPYTWVHSSSALPPQ